MKIKLLYLLFLMVSLITPMTFASIAIPDFMIEYQSSFPSDISVRTNMTCYVQDTSKLRLEYTFIVGTTDDRGITVYNKSYFTQIIRQDLNVNWRFNTFDKTYSEKPLKDNTAILSFLSVPKGSYTKTGEETLMGHQCDILQFDKPKMKVWIVKDIPGLELPIKTESGEGNQKGIIEAKKLVVGKQEDSLFEIPKGFEKVNSITQATIRDEHFLQLSIDPKSAPIFHMISIDLNRIKYTRDEKTNQNLVDVWLRFDYPSGNMAEEYVKDRKDNGLTTKGYEQYAYWLEHWQLSEGQKVCNLCRVDYTVDGNELWREERTAQWQELSPCPNDISAPVYNAIMSFAQRNKYLLTKNGNTN